MAVAVAVAVAVTGSAASVITGVVHVVMCHRAGETTIRVAEVDVSAGMSDINIVIAVGVNCVAIMVQRFLTGTLAANVPVSQVASRAEHCAMLVLVPRKFVECRSVNTGSESRISTRAADRVSFFRLAFVRVRVGFRVTMDHGGT